MALKQIRITQKGGDLPNSLFAGQIYTMEEAAANAYVNGGFAEHIEEPEPAPIEEKRKEKIETAARKPAPENAKVK